MPSKPPSPPGTTPRTFPTTGALDKVDAGSPSPAAGTRRISAVSRSETSADPSGKKATPQGLVRSWVMVCEDVIFVLDDAQPGERVAPEAMSPTARAVVSVRVSRTFPVCVRSPALAPVG